MSATTYRQFDRDTGRKSVLYCPECGHESPVGGDWRIDREATASETRTGEARERPTTDHERLVYTCPECGRVIATRPTHGLVNV